jgi:hypothetical protein
MSATEATPYNPARHWLRLGWWSVQCRQCGKVWTAPNLFCLRELLSTAARGTSYTVIRRAGAAANFRERFRLVAGRHRNGKLFKYRVHHEGAKQHGTA